MAGTILEPDGPLLQSQQSQPAAIGKTLQHSSISEDYDSFLSALAVPDTFAVRHAFPLLRRPASRLHTVKERLSESVLARMLLPRQVRGMSTGDDKPQGCLTT